MWLGLGWLGKVGRGGWVWLVCLVWSGVVWCGLFGLWCVWGLVGFGGLVLLVWLVLVCVVFVCWFNYLGAAAPQTTTFDVVG